MIYSKFVIKEMDQKVYLKIRRKQDNVWLMIILQQPIRNQSLEKIFVNSRTNKEKKCK